MSPPGFDAAVTGYREALGAFTHGDPEPVKRFFSRGDDVTLANPLGPPRRGWADVEQAVDEAAANFVGGSIAFEELSRYVTPGLGYVLHIERQEATLASSGNTARISLRVTMIFRPEGETWKLVHRHADPITTARSIETAIEA